MDQRGLRIGKDRGKIAKNPRDDESRLKLRGTTVKARATHRAALAQLVEHRIRNAGVTGSSPVSGTSP